MSTQTSIQAPPTDNRRPTIGLISMLGTTGDLRPLLALSIGLKRAGYNVKLFARDEYSNTCESFGLDATEWRPLRATSSAEHLNTPIGQKLLNKQKLTRSEMAELREYHGRELVSMTTQLVNECTGVDAIVSDCATADIGVWALAEAMDVPYVVSCPMPMAPTRAFNMVTPYPVLSLGLANRAVSRLALRARVRRLLAQPKFHEFRDRLNLPRCTHRSFEHYWLDKMQHWVSCSAAILDRPNDWGDNVQITGYCVVPPTQDYVADPKLVEFLNSGAPPVYFGFGSLPLFSGPQGQERICLVLKVLHDLGLRGILCVGPSVLESLPPLPDTVFWLDSAPHDWLFPQCSAAVHHGGYGTTHTCLAAGKPMIIYPYHTDQFLWAERMAALGTAPPRRLRSHQITERALTDALRFVGQASTVAAARALAPRLQAEDGIRVQIERISRLVRVRA